MESSRLKFRLGDAQSITFRFAGTTCRARACLGRVKWATQFQVSPKRVFDLASQVAALVETMAGVVEFEARTVSGLQLRISPTSHGALRADYVASGSSGGLQSTEWQVSGSFVGWPQTFLTIYPKREETRRREL